MVRNMACFSNAMCVLSVMILGLILTVIVSGMSCGGGVTMIPKPSRNCHTTVQSLNKIVHDRASRQAICKPSFRGRPKNPKLLPHTGKINPNLDRKSITTIAPCGSFSMGSASKPNPKWCTSVQSLNKTVNDRDSCQAVCECFRQVGPSFGLNPKLRCSPLSARSVSTSPAGDLNWTTNETALNQFSFLTGLIEEP